MSKEEFIDWIKSLGFSRTWQSNPDEYSIFPGYNDMNIRPHLIGPKLYFTIDGGDVGLYYSNFSNNVSFGSNLGRFPIEQIGDFEKYIILVKLSDHFDEIPPSFKQCLRELKLKNILKD